MLIVSGTIQIAKGKGDEMVAPAIAMATETRTEDGCFAYAFWRDLEDPDLFRVYEEWRDWDALKAHGAAPHMGTFRAALKEIGVVSRDIGAFDRGEVTAL